MTTTDQSDDYPTRVLAFRIADQEYCIDVMAVLEIRCWMPATPLPHSPAFMRGVVNLRGVVLPIIDLTARLGFPALVADARSVVIVVMIGSKKLGLLVDAVSDLLPVAADAVLPAPDLDSTEEVFVKNIVFVDGRMIGIVVLPTVLPPHLRDAA
jgi:purine-binding chemotaxis protein CheW